MNTYLIVGTINYFKEKEVKKIIKDNPHITFDLECNTLEELITEASFSSMFDDKKYIVVGHFVGNKNINEILIKLAQKQAYSEMF